MLNSRMSRHSFLAVSAAGLAATALDWSKIKERLRDTPVFMRFVSESV